MACHIIDDSMKKRIKLKFIDGFPENRYNLFRNRIEEEFDIDFSEQPDYVFCGCYSDDFRKYPNAIKILFQGENMTPDFNLYDYVVGFDHLSFGDRFLRYPLSLCDYKSLNLALHKHEMPDEYYKRKKFCNFVYSNNWCQNEIRNRLFQELSEKYKQVDSGGRIMNNVGGPVADKHAFLLNYKFTLSIENSSYTGYSTEKITDAFAAGSIPIYWGDPLITKVFNPKAFIRVSDYPSIDALSDRIREIDEDDELYMQMQRESIIPDDVDGQALYSTPNIMGEFVADIFRRPIEEAHRTCKDGYVTEYRKVIYAGWNRFLWWRRPVRKVRELLRKKK